FRNSRARIDTVSNQRFRGIHHGELRRGLMLKCRETVRVRMSKRGWAVGVFGACAMSLAGLVVAPAGATPGPDKVYSSDFTLACVLAPGVLNVKGNVAVHVSATGPSFVHNGDVFSLTNSTTSLTTPANWSTSFASLGANDAAGAVQTFGLVGSGTTPS